MPPYRVNPEIEVLSEKDLISSFLSKYGPESRPFMMQIGANEGMYEYAKKDGKDFVFDFLMNNPHWGALLIEPIPNIFEVLKKNYSKHKNSLSFLNCAITDSVDQKLLSVAGKEGKLSSLIERKRKLIKDSILVPCLPYSFACRVAGVSKVDFVKIDAEGYDEIIVINILEEEASNLLPKVIFWESLEKCANQRCEEKLEEKGYKVFLTGLNKHDKYMDKVAIHSTLLKTV